MMLPELMRMRNGEPVTDWNERRKELLEILAREEYGFLPESPAEVRGEILETEKKCCAGHALLHSVSLTFDTPSGPFSFPVRYFQPKGENVPLFILLNFRPDVYDMYYPAEEIIDHGYAVAMVYYEDIASDDEDFTNGLAACYPRRNDGTDWGKIGMWAFAASRCVDYFIGRPEIDSARISVIGHSRLGKTALWCGANDERVLLACSNDSGCSGASLERGKPPEAEHFADIWRRFPYWFCENFEHHTQDPDAAPFDQHFLLAACAPRYVTINSASLDDWACPTSEEAACRLASRAWEELGLKGFDGHVRYHLRAGIHFLSRNDWLNVMRDFDEIK